MRANEDAQIYLHLHEAFRNVLDQDVYLGLMDGQGHRKTIVVDGFSLDVTVTHREPKLEKLYGVDVVYVLGDWKTMFFQHKKRASDGSLPFSKKEQSQRDKIVALCDACSSARKFGDSVNFVRAYCASVYVIGDAEGKSRHVVSACRVGDYRSQVQRKTLLTDAFRQLPAVGDMETTDRMFLQCTIGRLLDNTKRKANVGSIEDALLTGPDLVFHAVLRQG